jgi:hypothetical protein
MANRQTMLQKRNLWEWSSPMELAAVINALINRNWLMNNLIQNFVLGGGNILHWMLCQSCIQNTNYSNFNIHASLVSRKNV